MSDDAGRQETDPSQQPLQPSQPRGLTRRGFIHTAGVSAAGAALMGGCAQQGGDNGHHNGDHPHLHGPVRPTSVAVDRDANLAVTTDDLKQVLLYNVAGDEPGQIDTFQSHDRKASYVDVAARKVFSASYDGKVFVSHLVGARKPPHRIFAQHLQNGGQETEVWVVAASSDGSRAVSATNGGQILLWAPETNPIRVFPPLQDSNEPVGGLDFVGDGSTHFLSSHAHGKVVLWDVTNPNLPGKQEFSHGNSHLVNSVSASPDGKLFASGGLDMTVIVWELATGKRVLDQPIRHNDWVWRVAFSPDGTRVASASQDGTVKVWNAKTGAEVAKFDVGDGGSMGVAWLDADFLIYTGNGAGKPVRKGRVPRV